MNESMSQKSLKILLVDDNEQITTMLTTFFKLSNQKCSVANEGREGLRLIENGEFDVVLLDLSLPDFDGYDIIDELEQKGLLQKNKIIVFTASSISKDSLNDLVKRGVHSYILKPVDVDQLFEKIQKIAQYE